MKKRDLEDKVRAAFASEAPDIRSRIEAACEKEYQEPPLAPSPTCRRKAPVLVKRAVAFTLCLAMFACGFLVRHFISEQEPALPSAETLVYLDVNPSIELQLDQDDRVVACIAGNEDATGILAELNLNGVELNTALAAIVGAMYVNGYLSVESNSILVSVDAKNESKTDALLADITAKINQVFEKSDLECSIIAQRVQVDGELQQRANACGVSVGKMHFVEKMANGMDKLDTDRIADLAQMSIKELHLMYSSKSDEEGEEPFEKDVVTGAVSGFLQKDDTLSALLETLNLGYEDIESYDIDINFKNHGVSGWKMVYTVTIIRKGEATQYQYDIDCVTGEILTDASEAPSGAPKEEQNDKFFEQFMP